MADENIWTGAVNFVLVSIPVAMMPAVREQRVAFRLMHEKDGAPLQRQMYCPVDDAVVEATLPFLGRHARGLVEFQRLTGCRGRGRRARSGGATLIRAVRRGRTGRRTTNPPPGARRG